MFLWLACVGALLALLLGWSVQPVSLRYVVVDDTGTSDANMTVGFRDARATTKGAQVLLGTSSHILPLVRIINYLGEPWKRSLVPFGNTSDMKQRAVAEIGHDDFGDMIDWAAFEHLVQVANDRCHLVGRVFVKKMLEDILLVNLKVQQLLSRHPEIEQEVIEKPVILAAFTRTGATFLYQVLAHIFDQELTPTYSYEIFEGPLDPNENENSSDRIKRAEAAIMGLGSLNPPMKILHEWVAADEPEDEPGWYQYTVQSLVIPFALPSDWLHARIYQESSQALNLRLWERLRKIKQWQVGRTLRFLLKAPEHLFGFPEVYKAHPDASFITVSRDETSWYPSSMVMTHLYRQMYSYPKVNETIRFADRLLCGQRQALKTAHNGSYEVLPVRFGKYLFTETFAVVERIAQFAGLPWDDNRQKRARFVIAKCLAWKKTKSAYRVADFGLSDSLIRDRLSTVCASLPEPVF